MSKIFFCLNFINVRKIFIAEKKLNVSKILLSINFKQKNILLLIIVYKLIKY